MRDEAGCACPGTKEEPGSWKKCDCSGNEPVAMVLTNWPHAMIGVGAFGLFFCLWVAILAIMATRTPSGCCSVWFYSTCSALLNLIFSAIGVAFIFVGLASSAPQSPIVEFNGENGSQCASSMSEMMNMDSNGKAAQCLTDGLCDALQIVLNRTTVLGFGIGIPYFVAGTVMFIACYACCCCKSQFSGETAGAGAGASNTAGAQDDDDFPGAEFYPPPAQAVSGYKQAPFRTAFPARHLSVSVLNLNQCTPPTPI